MSGKDGTRPPPGRDLELFFGQVVERDGARGHINRILPGMVRVVWDAPEDDEDPADLVESREWLSADEARSLALPGPDIDRFTDVPVRTAAGYLLGIMLGFWALVTVLALLMR